jgi:hypothetical protein
LFSILQMVAWTTARRHRRIIFSLLVGTIMMMSETHSQTAPCNCDPKTDISQYTSCKLERNPFGLMALVVHSSHNHACDPLEAIMDSRKCASETIVRHVCKYEGDVTGHRSCSDIKTAWTQVDPPEDSNYFIEIGGSDGIQGKTEEVFCAGMDRHNEPALTFRSCNQCSTVSGGEYLCSDVSCCAADGMTEQSFDTMPDSAKQHFSAINALGHDKFCTTDASSVQPQNFVGTCVDGPAIDPF